MLDATDDPFFHDPDSVFADVAGFPAWRAAGEVPRDARATAEDHHLDGGTRVRVYRPVASAPEPRPLVLFLHSGGWVFGSPEFEEARALRYTVDVDAVVVSVDYRLAPEHPFPAASEDAFAGLVWAVEQAAELGIDPSRVAVADGSAGGNLAASLALRARDAGGPAMAFQLLVYPALDDRLQTASMRDLADAPVLSTSALARAWGHYSPDGGADGYAAPARATSLAGLPPALVMVAECDPLRDDGLDYARALDDAGVSTGIVQVPGAPHGFDILFPGTGVAEKGLMTQVEALRDALSAPGRVPEDGR